MATFEKTIVPLEAIFSEALNAAEEDKKTAVAKAIKDIKVMVEKQIEHVGYTPQESDILVQAILASVQQTDRGAFITNHAAVIAIAGYIRTCIGDKAYMGIGPITRQ